MNGMNSEAKKSFDQIAREQRQQLLQEIQEIEEKKWKIIRDKMLKWLEDNGKLPKKTAVKKKGEQE